MKRRVSLIVFALLTVVTFQVSAEVSEKSYSISLSDGISLHMTVVRFEESTHKITKCNFNDWIGVCLIDGKPVFGTDADMPEYKVVKATVKIGAKSVALDVSCMYDPWYGKPDPKKFTVKKGYGGFIISGYISDGAGSYEAEWLVIENSSIRMRLVHGEC